jgi:hypothetical protein
LSLGVAVASVRVFCEPVALWKRSDEWRALVPFWVRAPVAAANDACEARLEPIRAMLVDPPAREVAVKGLAGRRRHCLNTSAHLGTPSSAVLFDD